MTNWIKEFFRRRKEEKDKRDAEYWEAHARSQRIAVDTLRELALQMNTKWCPFVTGTPCENCVHYKPGRVVDYSRSDEAYPIHKAYGPKCKLWGG